MGQEVKEASVIPAENFIFETEWRNSRDRIRYCAVYFISNDHATENKDTRAQIINNPEFLAWKILVSGSSAPRKITVRLESRINSRRLHDCVYFSHSIPPST